jgi:ADP-heptose:LPS heptosyltransferase
MDLHRKHFSKQFVISSYFLFILQPINKEHVVKFLIIRFSSIGDIVLTTPVIRCLKTQVENAEIHYLTKKAYAPVLADNPYIDKLHLLEGSLNETIQKLKDEKFDYIIDLHHNLRTFIVKNKLQILTFSFNKLNIEKWLMVTFKINRVPNTHIVDRYLETTRLFDIANDQKGLDYFISPNDEVNTNILPEPFCNGYVGLVIGAKHSTKKMPIDKINSLLQKMQLPVIILGGKEDIAEGEAIVKASGNLCFNACGKYNLGQSASLVKQARVIITHDTGLMHIAAAFKKKIVSIWGNTIPEFGMYPYLPDPDSCLFETKGLKCRPCSKIGYNKCPKGHFRCMNNLDENEIAATTIKLWHSQ